MALRRPGIGTLKHLYIISSCKALLPIMSIEVSTEVEAEGDVHPCPTHVGLHMCVRTDLNCVG